MLTFVLHVAERGGDEHADNARINALQNTELHLA